MDQTKVKYTEIAKKYTCGFLAGAVFCVSMAEILECPVHGGKSCQTQHIEQPYPGLATVSPSEAIS